MVTETPRPNKNIEIEYHTNEKLIIRNVKKYPKITTRIVDMAIKYTEGQLVVPSLEWFKPQIRHYVGKSITAPVAFWDELLSLDPILANVEEIYKKEHGNEIWGNDRKITLELRKP
jgi:hypothetical protein